MRHIFRINNNTVYIIAKAIIKKYDIQESKCIFFVERNLKIPETNQVKTAIFKLKNDNLFALPPLKLLQEIIRFDNFLGELIDGQFFTFYGFNFSRHVVQLFISSKYCKNVYQLEEGLACYQPKDYLLNSLRRGINLKRKVFNYLFLKNRLKSYGTAIDSAKGYFVMSNEAYQGFSPKINLLAEIINITNLSNIQDSIFIIFDASSTIGMVPIQKTLECFKSLLETLKISDKNIYLKFHPTQPIQERKEILNVRGTFQTITVLDDDFLIEDVIFSNNTNIYIGLLSSLLVYASITGNKSFSYLTDERIQEWTSKINMPKIFHKKVKGYHEIIQHI